MSEELHQACAELTVENLELKRQRDRAEITIQIHDALDAQRRLLQTALYDGDKVLQAEILKRHEEQAQEIAHVKEDASKQIRNLLYWLLGGGLAAGGTGYSLLGGG